MQEAFVWPIIAYDNVETLLLNLLRGSGVDGLAGIAPKTETPAPSSLHQPTGYIAIPKRKKSKILSQIQQIWKTML